MHLQNHASEPRQRKELGRHRPDCTCAACATGEAPCWSCGVVRRAGPQIRLHNAPPRYLPPHLIVQNHHPPPPNRPPGPVPLLPAAWARGRNVHQERRRGSRNGGPDVEKRMSFEDLRTWSLTYTLSVDVYVCAERYLMQDFKECIAAYIINNFEIAGLEAALPPVLQSCKTLHQGLSLKDPLLKKIFARVGFLQTRLWKNYHEETASFFAENPELAVLVMREMVQRKEEDIKDDLPAMERADTNPFPLSPRPGMIRPGPPRNFDDDLADD